MRDDSLTHLCRLFAAAHRRQSIDEETAEWLQRGILAVLSGEARSLDHALGLTWYGAEPVAARWARRRRNLHLAEALALCDGSPSKLAEAVRRFRLRKWPRWQRFEQPPERATELERILFHAFKVGGGKVPESRYRLSTAARQTPGSVVRRPGAQWPRWKKCEGMPMLIDMLDQRDLVAMRQKFGLDDTAADRHAFAVTLEDMLEKGLAQAGIVKPTARHVGLAAAVIHDGGGVDDVARFMTEFRRYEEAEQLREHKPNLAVVQ